MTDKKKIEGVIEITEVIDNDGIRISEAVIKPKGSEDEIPVTILYNGPDSLSDHAEDE